MGSGKKVMYNVLDISRYIINYSIDNHHPVSNLKLQKLLYYVQAIFLTNSNEPCFVQDIVHWRHGPVIVESYSAFRKYFNDNINSKQNIDTNLIGDSDKELIEHVVKAYRNMTPWDMVAKTLEEAPWLDTERNEIISNYNIKKYFSKNKNRILSEQKKEKINKWVITLVFLIS